MRQTVRIYGKVVNRWWGEDSKGRQTVIQEEIEYKEYDAETGKLRATGTEDFSPERRNKEIAHHWVYIWDGKKRNKGGYRWFESCGLCAYRKSNKKALELLMKTKFPGTELVQLRLH